MKNAKTWLLILCISIFVSLFLGRYGLSINETFSAICFQGDRIANSLLYNIRLPRILLVCLCGGALSIAGMVFQTIFKNSLASPDIIGTTSGCSLGAILGILFLNDVLMIELSSFIGGLLSLFLVYFLTRRSKGNEIVNLLISGIIVQAIFTSLIMAFKIVADPYQQLPSIEYWLMGGFADASWSNLLICFVLILISVFILYRLRWSIQIIGFGQEANTLGVDVKKIRNRALIFSILLVSSVVSVAGPVSWVGLLVPHMIRLWTNQPISKNYVLTLLVGAVFVLWCDNIARCLFTIELPISIVTSFFGALYLAIIFRRGKKVI